MATGPKYLRIHRDLSDRITSGQWPAGRPLPSQQQLAAEFGVSVMTLRQALQLLADDGLVQTRHGAGTFVAARYAYDLGGLRSFAADLSAQDADITTELLAAGTVAPPAGIAVRLGASGPVLRLRRLRLTGGPAPVGHAPSPPGRPGQRRQRGGPRAPWSLHHPGRARAGHRPRRRDHNPGRAQSARRPRSFPPPVQSRPAEPPGQLHRGWQPGHRRLRAPAG